MMTSTEEVRLLGWVQLRLWQRLGPRPSASAVDVLRHLAELYRGGRCHAFLGEDDGTLRFVLADTELGGDAFTAFAGRPLAAVGDGVEGASVAGDDEEPLDPEDQEWPGPEVPVRGEQLQAAIALAHVPFSE